MPLSLSQRIEATQQALEAAAKELGMTISGDGRIAEADAARLLALSCGHLRRLRGQGEAPAAYHVGLGGGRVSYRLSDISQWIELGRLDA